MPGSAVIHKDQTIFHVHFLKIGPMVQHMPIFHRTHLFQGKIVSSWNCQTFPSHVKIEPLLKNYLIKEPVSLSNEAILSLPCESQIIQGGPVQSRKYNRLWNHATHRVLLRICSFPALLVLEPDSAAQYFHLWNKNVDHCSKLIQCHVRRLLSPIIHRHTRSTWRSSEYQKAWRSCLPGCQLVSIATFSKCLWGNMPVFLFLYNF